MLYKDINRVKVTVDHLRVMNAALYALIVKLGRDPGARVTDRLAELVFPKATWEARTAVKARVIAVSAMAAPGVDEEGTFGDEYLEAAAIAKLHFDPSHAPHFKRPEFERALRLVNTRRRLAT